MDTNKKIFNFTLLFIIAYAALAVLVIIYIWWPKGNDSIVSNSKFTYEDIDEKEKAIDIYKTKIISLLAEKDLNQLYQKLNEEYKKGIELVLKQFKDVLTANGVKEIEAVGQPFDPELHEAVSMIQDEKLGEKIVAQEYRKGYMIGNKVIRHSMVVVAN